MAVHAGRVTAPALISVGAAFDFHAGRKREGEIRRQGEEENQGTQRSGGVSDGL